MLQWSLSITRELGDVCLLPAALSSPGLIAHAEGDLVAARDSFVAALDVHREWATGQACCPSSNGLQVWPRAEKAVRLFAAVAALREAVGWGRTPLERSDAEAEIAALRARIPRDVCAAAWADGEAMTLEQALEHAGPLA